MEEDDLGAVNVEIENICVTCEYGCGDHSCKECGKPCHAITPCCVEGEDEEEGYGSKVLCKGCAKKKEKQQNKSKPQPQQWWKPPKRPPGQQCESSGFAKRKKLKSAPAGAGKPSGTKQEDKKFACLECLKDLSEGNRKDERSPYLCRNDKSSIDRHKSRWHLEVGKEKCTFVPADSRDALKWKGTTAAADSADKTVDNDKQTGMESLNEVSLEVTDTEESRGGGSHEISSSSKKSSTIFNYIADDSDSKQESSTKEKTLDDVLTAIKNLDLKVTDFGKHHQAVSDLAFEDKELQKDVSAMKKAENIHQLVEATRLLQFFYDENHGTSVLRCLACFEYFCLTRTHCKNMTPLKAAQKLSTGLGHLGTGLFVSEQASKLIIEGHNLTWSSKKKLIIDHFTLLGEGTVTHMKAMKEYRKVQRQDSRKVKTAMNIFRSAIVDVKVGAAGLHLETLLSLVSLCGVDVGDIGHSRKHFPAILKCIEKIVDQRCNKWLTSPLPSTGLPPHFWITIDKATPSRTTNQALLLVGRNDRGEPCPVPVDAPVVYNSDYEAASYEKMAELIVKTMSDKFSTNILNRVCGVAADGPYQTTSFRDKLLELLEIADKNLLALPVTWDPAHMLNLGVTDVFGKDYASGKHFRRFVKRCNVFNTIMANGKGFAFLQITDAKAKRPVSYATQRFASSSYKQWVNIEDSYDAYWKTFEHLYPDREEEEEYQYMIAGYDFVSDLLAFLDTLAPVVDLMLRVQSLDCPIWKLKQWWPVVKMRLQEMVEKDNFPRVKKHSVLKPGDEFKGVTLLEGWLFEECESNNSGKATKFNWSAREENEVREDRLRFAADLLDSIDNRVRDVTSMAHIGVLEVFDAVKLVTLQCGIRMNGAITRNAGDSAYEVYGVHELKKLLKVVSKMKDIQEYEINFDVQMAHRYMMGIKELISAGIWQGLCSHWFIDVGTNLPIKLPESVTIDELEIESTNTFEPLFNIRLSSGKMISCRVHEQSVYASFYADEAIYSIAGAPSCILIDIALAKGGPEAIAESFYATMRAQQQPGGQYNETLVARTKLSWSLPALRLCDDIIKDSIKIYFEGDETIKPHKSTVFSSTRATEYEVSKVIDRIGKDEGRCPFLVPRV